MGLGEVGTRAPHDRRIEERLTALDMPQRVTLVIALIVLAGVVGVPRTEAQVPGLIGDIPADGGLMIWSGGSIEQIHGDVRQAADGGL